MKNAMFILLPLLQVSRFDGQVGGVDACQAELQSGVIQRLAKISQSRRRPLLGPQFHISLPFTVGSMPVQHSVLNVKTLVGAFNLEKVLVGLIVIVKSSRTYG